MLLLKKYSSLLFALLLCTFAINNNATAQTLLSVGHINTADLLQSLPEVKAAESQLETLSKQLEAQYDQKIKAIEADYKAIQAKAQELSQVQLQQEEENFQKRYVELGNFESDAQKQVMDKRQSLLEPLLKRVEDAIEQVAIEKGYTYVLDTSSGMVLYAQPSEDITTFVKAKL